VPPSSRRLSYILKATRLHNATFQITAIRRINSGSCICRTSIAYSTFLFVSTDKAAQLFRIQAFFSILLATYFYDFLSLYDSLKPSGRPNHVPQLF
jgi:hypothetical protein